MISFLSVLLIEFRFFFLFPLFSFFSGIVEVLDFRLVQTTGFFLGTKQNTNMKQMQSSMRKCQLQQDVDPQDLYDM